MKLKRFIFLLITFMFLIPFLKAESCDCSGIKIDSIELNSIWGSAEEISRPTINDNKINLDIRLYSINDEISYDLKIKNTTNSDVKIDEILHEKNADYIEYKYTYEGNNLLTPGEEKMVTLVIKYKNKVPSAEAEDNSYIINDKVFLNLSSDITNPKTGLVSSMTYIILAIIFVAGLVTVFVKEKKSQRIAVVIGLLLIIPLVVKAESCGCEIEIDAHISIDTKEAMFDTGEIVNIKMKRLAGNNEAENKSENENILAIIKSSTEPTEENKEEKNIVSSETSPFPIYMWLEDGTMYWWSEDDTPSLNPNAAGMFAYLYNLSDLSGLRTYDASTATTFRSLLAFSTGFENVEDLKYWDTSNVTNFHYLFGITGTAHNAGHVSKLKDITGLRNWNTSKVTNMTALLQNVTQLKTLDGLEKWDTSNVTSMKNIFGGTVASGLTDISAVGNWNTSKVTTMQWLLENQVELTDIEPLRNWDVSKVEHMGGMFAGNTPTGMHIANFEPISGWNTSSATTFQYLFQKEYDLETVEFLKNWDTSKVTEMLSVFLYCEKLKTLDGLEGWNMSSATTLEGMFSDTTSLEDASAINDWDITNVTKFSGMFSNSPVRPEFTKISGTWNGGTFVPNE